MPYMPFDSDQLTDSSHENPPAQSHSAIAPSSGIQPSRRDEPRGIHRYFQAQPRPSQTQATQVSWTASSGTQRSASQANTPPTPATLTRTPSRIAVVLNSSSRISQSHSLSRDASNDSMEGLIVTSDINPPRRPAPAAPALQPSPMAPSSATPRPRGRPPGRPPGTKNVSTSRSQVAKTPSTAVRSTTTTAAAAAAAATPAAQTPATDRPTVKRRGRPFGWRPGMGSYAALNGGTAPPPRPATGTKGPPKKRGRPAGRPGVKPTRAIWDKLKPRYIPFLCEWDGCPAELQNMDTLRKHVMVVHARDGEERGCRWGKCVDESYGKGEGRVTSRQEFERHMEQRHLIPYAWHMGDGPRNTVGMDYEVRTPEVVEGGTTKELPAYLFDAEGNQVTPSVVGLEIESEEDKKERKRRLRRLLLLREKNAPEELPSETEGDGEDGVS